MTIMVPRHLCRQCTSMLPGNQPERGMCDCGAEVTTDFANANQWRMQRLIAIDSMVRVMRQQSGPGEVEIRLAADVLARMR